MRPIIVTLPRTGSTLITELLGSIAMEHYGYKNILQEYFSINTLYRQIFERNSDDVIVSTYFNRVFGNYFTSQQIELEKIKRINLIGNDYQYMIKLIVHGPIGMPLQNFIKNYDIIYLERKDKLRQYISHMHMSGTNIAHYTKNSKNIKQIVYWKNLRDDFLTSHKIYHEYKKLNPSKYPILYYEDFIAHGSDRQALIKLLNLDITVDNNYKVNTVPSPYISENIEDLILNKKEWLQDREYIYNALYKDM